MTARIIPGDCLDGLRTLPDRSVQTCVTSPPYYGLRDYGHEGQIGLEQTPEAYVAKMVEVFREVKRVLRDDGTLWLNIGDSYAGSGKGPAGNLGAKHNERHLEHTIASGNVPHGCKPKDLIGIPWMLAFALRADGWYLRQDIIWHKPNPMPESVGDRCTKAHEYVFLLSKSERYYYDSEAVSEASKYPNDDRKSRSSVADKTMPTNSVAGIRPGSATYPTRNRRSVWSITTKPFKGAHFAVMPEDLVEPCVLAGSKAGDTILDPFTGSGTVAVVALRHGRNFVGCELNTEYIAIAKVRIADDAPLLNVVQP